MFYPDYMVDLAAAIARDRGEAGGHRREGAAVTAGRHGGDAGPGLWLPPVLVGGTVLLVFYAMLAFHLGFVLAGWVLALAVGLWLVGAATLVGVFALAGRKARGPVRRGGPFDA